MITTPTASNQQQQQQAPTSTAGRIERIVMNTPRNLQHRNIFKTHDFFTFIIPYWVYLLLIERV